MTAPSPLLGILAPWAGGAIGNLRRWPFVTVSSSMKNASLPPGIRFVSRPKRGKRISVRWPGVQANVSSLSRRWPEDRMIESPHLARLAYVFSGSAALRVGEGVVHCSSPAFILIPPGISYSDCSEAHLEKGTAGAEHCDIIWFSRWPQGVQCHICHSQNGRHRNRGAGEVAFVTSSVAGQLMDVLTEEATRTASISPDLRDALLHSFLLAIRRELESPEAFYPSAFHVETTFESWTHSEVIDRARAFTVTRLKEPLTLDRVARHVYLSRSRFAAFFRAETGQTFHEFLTTTRLDEARTLLCQTSMPISHIAKYVGLSPTHLARLFKARFGLSPETYRRNAGKTGNEVGG
jgi:AraC-like DNA-binding protein